jgi:hypothetical protein
MHNVASWPGWVRSSALVQSCILMQRLQWRKRHNFRRTPCVKSCCRMHMSGLDENLLLELCKGLGLELALIRCATPAQGVTWASR